MCFIPVWQHLLPPLILEIILQSKNCYHIHVGGNDCVQSHLVPEWQNQDLNLGGLSRASRELLALNGHPWIDLDAFISDSSERNLGKQATHGKFPLQEEV